jgi:zinc finger protein
MSASNLFPSIGTIAEKTDAIPDIPSDAPPAQPVFDEERPLEEIESLCMSCGEQVGLSAHISPVTILIL